MEMINYQNFFNNMSNRDISVGKMEAWPSVQENIRDTRWFKYDRDWFVCKQAALRSSCATLREWSHNFHPPSCSG